MKKLPLLVLLSVFVFWGCNNDDNEGKNEVVISFENILPKEESEFFSNANEANNLEFQKDSFKDPQNLVTFEHYYANWGNGYSFASFTYMNKTDNRTATSPAPICGTGKNGKVYVAAYSNSYTPAIFTISNPDKYSIKGTWITNSTWAYNGMTQGDGYATPFKKDSWYKVTATGYDQNNKEIGKVEIALAKYQSDNDLPVKDWIWFDLTSLKDAVKIEFMPNSSDSNEYGPKTAQYFCLDGITLIEK